MSQNQPITEEPQPQAESSAEEAPKISNGNVRKNILSNQSRKETRKLVENKNVTLTEDCFGIFLNESGQSEKIYRYTWCNHNEIEVEVISYGARIRAIKIPDKNGRRDDIVLGFRDLAGYIYYDNVPFGGTIGRVSSYVENSTFVIDGKQYWLNANNGRHHYNGGVKSLDRVVWTPYVDGTKVIFSYCSPDLQEGYPGDLSVRIFFELTPKNEFTINMEAVTTKPTIVNLSNLTYFNLAGHHAGSEEIYKHTVTINSNCYTINNTQQLPTGEMQNVVYTDFDFQIPIVLKTRLGVAPDDGFNQNFCINRGIDQGLCFVARALHVPTGRILEVYSNQCGVNFATANDFGSGKPELKVSPSLPSREDKDEDDDVFQLLNKIHNIFLERPENACADRFEEIKYLVEKLEKCKFPGEEHTAVANVEEDQRSHSSKETSELCQTMRALQLNCMVVIKDLTGQVESSPTCDGLQKMINKIMDLTKPFNETPDEAGDQQSEKEHEDNITDAPNLKPEKKESSKINAIPSLHKDASNLKPEKKESPKINAIPKVYKDGRIHGKNNAVYAKHGAIAFQTQNYPNAIHHPNFPNCVLRPGETYRHTIVYKFWVQSGNPNKWMKRQGYLPRKGCS